MALLLDLRGTPALHASAVEIDGRAVAFAGSSGVGKTTTAALLCAAGGRLVTDDVLTVQLEDGAPWCPPGSAELRLRPKAAGIMQHTGWSPPTRRVADGRVAVRADAVDDRGVELAALVFPVPDRSAARPVLRRIRPADAVFRIAGAARIVGWSAPDVLERAFAHAARMAQKLPVFDAAVPWGPPWRPERVRELVDMAAGLPG